MEKARWNEVLKTFDGESSEVEEWLTKFNLVTSLSKIKLEEKARILPMYLEGPALAVYIHLDEEEKKDVKKIEEKMVEAFGKNAYNAYEELIGRKWNGEQIEVYVTDIKKLAKTAGIEGETIIRRAFVAGLNDELKRGIRTLKNVEKMSLTELMEFAKEFVAVEQNGRCSIIKRKEETQLRRGQFSASENELKEDFKTRRENFARNLENVQCYECGRTGHYARDCNSRRKRNLENIRCFKCGKLGHYAIKCNSSSNFEEKKEKNKSYCFTCKEEGHDEMDCGSVQGNE